MDQTTIIVKLNKNTISLSHSLKQRRFKQKDYWIIWIGGNKVKINNKLYSTNHITIIRLT